MLCKHGRKHIRSGARVREKEKPFWTLGRHRRVSRIVRVGTRTVPSYGIPSFFREQRSGHLRGIILEAQRSLSQLSAYLKSYSARSTGPLG